MKRILLLRPEEKVEKIEVECAEIINFPVIRLVEDDFSIEDYDFDTFVFTSSFAFSSFKKRMGDSFEDMIKGKRIIAIGEKTASVINFRCEIPEKQSWKGIVNMVNPGERILIVRSRDGNVKLPEELSKKGAIVKILNIYHSEVVEKDFEKLCIMFRKHEIDAIIFSSGRIVESFFELFYKYCGKEFLPAILVSLGEETSARLIKYHVDFIEMEKPDIFFAVKKICNMEYL